MMELNGISYLNMVQAHDSLSSHDDGEIEQLYEDVELAVWKVQTLQN